MFEHTAELGEKNIFEEIFNLLERHRMSLERSFPLGDFYDIINDFDTSFQRFNRTKKNLANQRLYNELLHYMIGNFLTIFKAKGFQDEPIYYAFKRFIAFFSLVLKEANLQQNKNDILESFFENFPSLRIDITKFQSTALIMYSSGYDDTNVAHKSIDLFENNFPYEIGIHDLEGSKKFVVYGNDYNCKTIIWDGTSASFKIIDSQYYTNVSVYIKSESDTTDKLLTPLWLITSSLESIKNARVELLKIEKGSLKANFRIWMKDLVAKEEVRIVLNTAKEIAVKTLTDGKVSIAELKKSEEETKQLKLENEQLSKSINQSPSEKEAKFEKAVDLERKILENERLEIENAKAKLELIETLSSLVARGVVQADTMDFNINGILFILKENDEIREIGPDVSDIT